LAEKGRARSGDAARRPTRKRARAPGAMVMVGRRRQGELGVLLGFWKGNGESEIYWNFGRAKECFYFHHAHQVLSTPIIFGIWPPYVRIVWFDAVISVIFFASFFASQLITQAPLGSTFFITFVALSRMKLQGTETGGDEMP
jgi:hypothetical protein